MDEREWLACSSVWNVELRELPGLSYRRFDYFLASVIPFFFGGGLCTSCQEMLKLLAANADQSPPKAQFMRRGYKRLPECRAHRMAYWVALYAEGLLLISECWDHIRELRCESPPTEDGAAAMGILRDIFGNPFRPVSLAPAWRTPPVLALAQAAYDHRTLPAGALEPDRLTVLADALEETGCTDADILGHLRGPGPHVRGCFVLDTLLDKS